MVDCAACIVTSCGRSAALREPERQRLALRAHLAEHLDDHVVAAQWCNRAGLHGDDGLRALKAIRRWTARGDHPADRASAWMIAALTPARLIVFRGRHARATPPVAIRDVLASWPPAVLDLHSRRHQVESFFASTGSTHTARVRRATIRWQGEERPLELDLPDDQLTREFLAALEQAISDARASTA